jgi:hypothetical protein
MSLIAFHSKRLKVSSLLFNFCTANPQISPTHEFGDVRGLLDLLALGLFVGMEELEEFYPRSREFGKFLRPGGGGKLSYSNRATTVDMIRSCCAPKMILHYQNKIQDGFVGKYQIGFRDFVDKCQEQNAERWGILFSSPNINESVPRSM